MVERRMARTAAVGAAGAIAVGAVFGLTAGQLGGAPTPLSQTPTGNGQDALFHEERGERPSRGLARGTQQPAAAIPRVQQPTPSPSPEPAEPEGPPAEPLPPTPEDCEEYTGNRQTGCTLLAEFDFGLEHMPALDNLWTRESGWNHQASNPSSGAYGIPQALPGSKMASVAADWETNPATQVRWGLGYIRDRYGNPTAAWEFFQANGWY
jgi:hypothetical protein